QSFIHRTKFVPNINSILFTKISSVEPPGLQLQNHFANESLFRRERNGPQQRQAILVKDAHVFLEVVRVLEIDSAEVRKRRNSDADHVAAVPQRVSINKPA